MMVKNQLTLVQIPEKLHWTWDVKHLRIRGNCSEEIDKTECDEEEKKEKCKFRI